MIIFQQNIRHLVGAIIVILLLPLWLPLSLIALGYSVNEPGWKVAEQAVQKNSGVGICSKIIFMPWRVFSPSTNEQRQHCVYEYAKLTKDPSACELLMPSEYGWSCLGMISEKMFTGRLCTRSGSLEHIQVYCNRDSEGELSIDRPQIENCSQYNRKDLREWCFDTRTELLQNVYECERITHDVVRDHCEYNYALKMRDPSLCVAVQDEERRAFCTTRVTLSARYRGK